MMTANQWMVVRRQRVPCGDNDTAKGPSGLSYFEAKKDGDFWNLLVEVPIEATHGNEALLDGLEWYDPTTQEFKGFVKGPDVRPEKEIPA